MGRGELREIPSQGKHAEHGRRPDSGTLMFLPPEGASRGVAFTEEQLAFLKNVAPDVAEKIGLLSNEQRAEVKEVIVKNKGGRPRKQE